MQSIETVRTVPTPDMEIGVYRVVNIDGIYIGHFRVCQNWIGTRFVMRVVV